MEVDSQAELTDQSSYLTPDTNRTRRGRRVKEEEKMFVKKKGLGVRKSDDGGMEEESSADKSRAPTLGLRNVKELMKSLEILSLNMERMMRRIIGTSKGDPTLEKLNTENMREIRRVRQ
jgi:hypothetical protein